MSHCIEGSVRTLFNGNMEGGEMDNLSDKVALVTGASRGIGRAAAIALAKMGVRIAVNFLTNDRKARQTLDEIENAGGSGVLIQADVSSSDHVLSIVNKIEQDLGPIDILVNNAGMIRPQSLEEVKEQDWDLIIDINLKSAFLCTQAVLKTMRSRKWGRIINIASLAAQVGGLVGPHYSAAKAGLLGLTHCYAKLLADQGITVNAINPALIETDMVIDNPLVNPQMVPIGRFGAPEEVAAVVAMLAGNGYITGQSISVNGGMYFT
jgi:3-oxoacyl-[acyl-carrier protein] reductase